MLSEVGGQLALVLIACKPVSQEHANPDHWYAGEFSRHGRRRGKAMDVDVARAPVFINISRHGHHGEDGCWLEEDNVNFLEFLLHNSEETPEKMVVDVIEKSKKPVFIP